MSWEVAVHILPPRFLNFKSKVYDTYSTAIEFGILAWFLDEFPTLKSFICFGKQFSQLLQLMETSLTSITSQWKILGWNTVEQLFPVSWTSSAQIFPLRQKFHLKALIITGMERAGNESDLSRNRWYFKNTSQWPTLTSTENRKLKDFQGQLIKLFSLELIYMSQIYFSSRGSGER